MTARSPRSKTIPIRRALKWGVALATVLALVALGDPREFARRHGAKQRLSIATGGTGGVWYPYGGGIAKIIGEHVRNVEATAEVTSASVDNLKFLAGGTADVAFTMADALADGARGTGPFVGFGRVPAAAIAVLYPNVTQLVTFDGSGIHRLADLRGKVVSTGSPNSGTEAISLRLLAAAGLDPAKDVRRQPLGAAPSADALKDGKIDAFFWSGGVPTGALLDLAQTQGHRMVIVPLDDALPAMRRTYGDSLYFPLVIARDAYRGLTGDVQTIAVANVLVVDRRMNDSLAYEITRAMFEHQSELAAIHPEARKLSLATAVAGSPVPYHPGAIRYYRERGAWPR